MADEIAILVSFVSLGLAATALGWNVYRDVLLKPRVKIALSVSTIHGETGALGKYVTLTATNHGPGPVQFSMIHGRNAPLWRRLRRRADNYVIIHDYKNPLSGQLPSRIEVGQPLTLLLPFDANSFLKDPMTHIGLKDSFGRIHWASGSSVRNARSRFREAFPGASAQPSKDLIGEGK